jgi:hypothetical protein
MPTLLRTVFVALAAIACHQATAQTAVPPTLTVQRIAPQLIAFAGSQANFQSLVNGLAQGTSVQLVTVLPDGSTQVVTFTPAAPMSPTEIAQVLETARQRLIGLGIANPTAEQIAVTLMGGTVPTALGGSQIGGILRPQTTPSPALQAQANAAGGATTIPAPGVSVQTIPGTTASTASTSSIPRINTSDSAIPAGAISRSPVPTTPNPVPGPAVSTSPVPPGERASGLQGAPTASAPAAPATAPQPGSTNSALRAR